jgi:hypothetical protein
LFAAAERPVREERRRSGRVAVRPFFGLPMLFYPKVLLSLASPKILRFNKIQTNLVLYSAYSTLASPKILRLGKMQIKFAFALDLFVSLCM